MPLSPFFANLILKDFDRSIEYADINMVRYADDLICFAGSQNACEDIHGHVRESLAREKLQIPDPGHNSKTQIYAPNQAADFLVLQLRPQNGDYLLEISEKQTGKVIQRITDLADIEGRCVVTPWT